VTTIEDAAARLAPRQRPLRVTMLGIRGYPNVQGGAENHVQHLAVGLVKLGCDVEVIVRSPYVPKQSSRRFDGTRLVRMWSPRQKGVEAVVHTFLGLLRAMFTRPDVLHIHSVGPALFTPLARLFGLRVVITHHLANYEIPKWGLIARAILRLGECAGMLFANGRIAVSNGLAIRMQRTYRIPVAVIPNGIGQPRRLESTSKVEAFGLQPQRYVLTVARVDEQKRQLDLISAFARVRNNGWKLAIVGGCDYESEYTRMVARAAADSPGVVLLDYQSGDALAELYTHAGLFVLPSSHEGQPIAALEAISYRCPIVLSDIPAHHEIGISSAQFVHVGDVDELAKLLELRFAVRFDQGLDALEHQRFMKDHDWQEIARRTLNLYISTLSPDGTITRRSRRAADAPQ
jgi:glycosyltransferase involved in cell wall biosynthesis